MPTMPETVMPSLHLAYDELTAIVRCLNSHFRTISYVFGRRRVVVASTILFNSELYKKKKNRRNVARLHVVGASHDPRTGIARWSHGDRAKNARFLLVVFEQKSRTMNVGSCDDRRAPARLSQSRRTMPVQCP